MNSKLLLFIALPLLCSTACAPAPASTQAGPAATPPSLDNRQKTSAETNRPPNPYGPPALLGTLQDPSIKESSGLAASRLDQNLFWTHNDSGQGPYLYAFDRAGKSLGVWQVTGAKAVDWEDLAAGPGPETGRSYLYIGDIGDNDEERAQITVYRIPEPALKPEDASSTKRNPRTATEVEAFRLRYPDGKHDAEALMIHPLTGDLYIVTKTLLDNPGVYRAAAPLNASAVTTLERLGNLSVPGILGGAITGGDISPDGLRVALCDYMQGYELELPASAHKSFDEIWKRPMAIIALGQRKQGEAICYRLDGKALLTTSDEQHSPLIEVVRRRK